MNKRILLKLSGEQFAGKGQFGIDTSFLLELALELKEVVVTSGTQIVIVVGGGNFLRGATLSKAEQMIERATADYMGMLATVMNGMALVDILEKSGQPARLQTKIRCDNVAEPYIRRRAIRHLEKGRVVIIAGGTGNPFVTTDTAAVSAALELGCEIVLKATKVDGVYDKDPKKFLDAIKLSELTYDRAMDDNVKVMDDTSIALAKDNNLPIVVCNMFEKGNLLKIIQGNLSGCSIVRK